MAVAVNGADATPTGTARSTGVRSTEARTNTESPSTGAAVTTSLPNAPTLEQAITAFNTSTGQSLNPLEPWVDPNWDNAANNGDHATFNTWIGAQLGYLPDWGTNLNAQSSLPLNVPLPQSTAAQPIVPAAPPALAPISPPPDATPPPPSDDGSGSTTTGTNGTAPDSGSTLAAILSFLSNLGGGNGASGSGSSGIAPAAGDMPGTNTPISSLPALTPIGTPTQTTSAGSPEVVLGVVAAIGAGIGFYLYERHKKKTAKPPIPPPGAKAA